MDAQIRARLEAAGFVETNVQQLFGLTSEENELIETRIVLAQLMKDLRKQAHMSQAAVARRIGSDQSRVARAERSDPSVSIDLMFRIVLALGANRQQIGHALSA